MGQSKGIKNSQGGWTLVELLVVCMIIVIVAAIAFMQRGNTNEQFKRQNVAWGLKNAFERARFDSVKRRPKNTTSDGDLYAFVTVNNTTFTMATDRNADGALNNSEPVTTNFGAENITIQYLTGPSSANMPASVVFNTRGEPTSLGADNAPVAPAFLICNGTCAGGRTAANSNIVLVTPSGTVNLLPGDASVPGFANPTVSNVGVSDFINSMLSSIGTGSSSPIIVAPVPPPPATPTPVPSVTPTGTPGPSPTATPTGTPTPTPDPSATPTATPSVTPTPTITPTPTPAVCTLSAPGSVSFGNNGPQAISVSYANSTGSPITISKTAGPDNWSFTPTSVTPLGTSGNFSVTFTYNNGNAGKGTGSFTMTGCGAARTVNVTVTNN